VFESKSVYISSNLSIQFEKQVKKRLLVTVLLHSSRIFLITTGVLE